MSSWILLAFASAISAGMVSILGKLGVTKTPSNLATAIRTAVVLGLAWAIVAITGATAGLSNIDQPALIFLMLSGLTTGASWLMFFKALQTGGATKVVAIDRLSLVFTVLIGFTLLGESAAGIQILGLLVVSVGTVLVVYRKVELTSTGYSWLPYALGAAFFATATTVLASIGLVQIDSNLATAIRTSVVLVLVIAIVLFTGQQKALRTLDLREVVFLILSGLATGASWLFFFSALASGPVSGVVPIDKLSIVVTAIISFFIFGEKQTRWAVLGLAALVAGAGLLAFG
jgi:bacterial/archaeal transporter family protein